ncbi:hypothetical protein C5167_006972 [Papaver somniferum]|uniref:Coiled-coil domain-containing protein 86 n=1 Tax=Papaver somniferum TaxID=3469 RepID=A0A4Y7JF11_PAPSO|nr:uncharacterized protein LOC113271584 [Papaver somniferum]RZC59673.1 hypothetical protein C5167_006972 [Papaver somniferum]
MACTIDFRRLDEGLGGTRNKRKRSDEEELEFTFTNTSMDVDDEGEPSAKRTAISSAEGKPTYDGVIAGRVSGRKWKQPRTKRASAMNIKVNPRTFDERMKEKEIKKAFKSRVDELKLEIKNNKIEKRLEREKREKKKQENILRTGTKIQKITNPKTLKKISKSKNKGQLRKVPDEMFKRK